MRTERLSLRLVPSQKELLAAASELQHRSLTDFVLSAACAAAEDALASRTRFVLDDDEWERFQAALDRPVKDEPRLRAFMQEPSIFD